MNSGYVYQYLQDNGFGVFCTIFLVLVFVALIMFLAVDTWTSLAETKAKKEVDIARALGRKLNE